MLSIKFLILLHQTGPVASILDLSFNAYIMIYNIQFLLFLLCVLCFIVCPLTFI